MAQLAVAQTNLVENVGKLLAMSLASAAEASALPESVLGVLAALIETLRDFRTTFADDATRAVSRSILEARKFAECFCIEALRDSRGTSLSTMIDAYAVDPSPRFCRAPHRRRVVGYLDTLRLAGNLAAHSDTGAPADDPLTLLLSVVQDTCSLVTEAIASVVASEVPP